ncbi:hypothetical protein [Rhodoferax fermentans]|uniref:Uncharacterized protein n=1 Tax=Rhodoferax fermentans TaxID=28066 RepID=A0A1T1ANP3_RHOFE|nr:hypothetical protein [Rhodoferax fermentans]MBK1685535.1 hypothetical protein [Rhodoferax fermentans]OOV05657.1 hypothetical protein RF819_02075 [Rhodoferax fermentans]
MSDAPTLAAVVHTQSDELWDVIALLEGARELPFKNQGESGERLIRQAIERIQGVQAAFDPYI